MEEYEFVKGPAEDYFCMICAKLLNEPHLTDCCGQHFCGVCFERWFEKQAKKICPHCRSESFSYIRSIPLKRKINALQVYCPFKKEGCEEITNVGEVKTHKDVCGFALVICNQGCGATVLRKNLLQHCDQKCPKRKVKCKFCGKVDHIEVINGEHVNTCEYLPVKCPRGCGQSSKIKRKDLAHHAQVCPLERVPCTFHEAGCDVMVLRKDLSGHLESSMQEHLMKMMTSHMELKREHNVLKEECSRLSSQLVTLTLAEPVKLDENNRSFTFHPTSSEGWVSPPFYVLDGYKFCIKHKSEDTVSLLLLRGEFDDKLRWPIDLRYKLEISFSEREKVTSKDVVTSTHQAPLMFRLDNTRLGRVEVTCSCKELVQFYFPLVSFSGTGFLVTVTVFAIYASSTLERLKRYIMNQ